MSSLKHFFVSAVPFVVTDLVACGEGTVAFS
jgi:hypothetical protein